MNQTVSLPALSDEIVFESIAGVLAGSGWGVLSEVLEAPLLTALRARAIADADFRQAAIGREHQRQVDRTVRSDRIAWITGSDAAERQWLDWCDRLRRYLNRALMLNLVEFESHFAHYPPNAFYQRHTDAFKGARSRLISLVLYLNPGWKHGEGGELVLYDAEGRPLACAPPRMGQLAVFLSEEFPHEVLPTCNDRYSVTGWFRCRADLPVAAGSE